MHFYNQKPTQFFNRFILSCIFIFSSLFLRGENINLESIVTADMATIPGGDFEMTGGQLVGVSDFKIDKYEITIELWNRVFLWAQNNGYNLSAGDSFGANNPVHSINWFDAVKWCNARSEMLGLNPAYYIDIDKKNIYRSGTEPPLGVNWDGGYRLPTEVEWEKAARGGIKNKKYPWGGDTISPNDANYHDSGNNKTIDVGSYLPNAYGVYDMAGNVMEWCWDWYGPLPSSSQSNPRGSQDGFYRVMRGGGWRNVGQYCEISYRNNFVNPQNAYRSLGFRTVLPSGTPSLSGKIEYYSGSQLGVSGVTLKINDGALGSTISGSDGSYTINGPKAGSVTLTPILSNDMPVANGVTTADITLIRRHVLGLAALDSPYKVLAGDVNGSDSVTTADITLIRRLILGSTTNFSTGLWRFVPADELITNTAKPWTASRMRQYTFLASGEMSQQNFKAIKLGDVNGSWKQPATSTGTFIKSKTRGALVMEEVKATTGNTVGVPVLVEKLAAVTSVQFTLRWDPRQLELISVNHFGIPGLTVDNFNLNRAKEGILTVSWDSPNGQNIPLVEKMQLFELQMKAMAEAGTTAQIVWVESPTPFELTSDFKLIEIETVMGGVVIHNNAPITTNSLHLKITQIVHDGSVELEIRAAMGGIVNLETAISLDNWVLEKTVNVSNSGSTLQVILPRSRSTNARYWRIKNHSEK